MSDTVVPKTQTTSPTTPHLVEAVTSPNETFVGVFPPSVRSACFLLQEALPARAPGLVGTYPFLGPIDILHVRELASKSVQTL